MLKKLDKGPGLFLCLFMLLPVIGQAQQIRLEGGFVEDSLGIGEEIHFWMHARYPMEMQLMLPDTNTSFRNFEFVRKDFTPTRLIDGMAYDSAAYTLQSFEIDPVQFLKLSAIVLTDGDSLTIESNLDSIYFRALVPVVTDTTELKTNLDYQSVHRQFNFPLFWIVVVGLIVVAIIFFLVFGGKIRKQLKLKRLRKDYQLFSEGISRYIKDLESRPEPNTAEEALALWKRYLEKLERQPYTKYTTKEILTMERNSELKDTLKEIDKTVYGKIEQTDIYQRFQDIEDFTQHRYSMALDRLKNG